MANSRTTAGLLDSVLRNCGELTSSQGTSPLVSDALAYLTQLHTTIICGGNELETDIDESWVWAKALRPTVINLSAPITAGSITLTNGSVTGTFSSAPTASVSGWYLKSNGGPEIYRIGYHQAASSSFQLDAEFPQTSYSGAYTCFKLEYDLTPSYIIIDGSNDRIDYQSTGTAGTTAAYAQLTWGTYSPTDLTSEVALEMTDSNNLTWSCAYASDTGLFSIAGLQHGTSATTYTLIGNGDNYYRSALDTLGFDYLTQTGTGTQNVARTFTGTYPFAATARLTAPARIYYGNYFGLGQQSGQVSSMDIVAFDRQYPLLDVRQGAPDYFAVTYEKNGVMRVRFNKYPTQQMRVEFETVPYPKDLQNNASSIPRIPRKWVRILEYGASYYLLLGKNSDKSATYLQLAQQLLKGMMKANRQDLLKTSSNFGAVLARPDLMPSHRRLNTYGYDAGET